MARIIEHPENGYRPRDSTHIDAVYPMTTKAGKRNCIWVYGENQGKLPQPKLVFDDLVGLLYDFYERNEGGIPLALGTHGFHGLRRIENPGSRLRRIEHPAPGKPDSYIFPVYFAPEGKKFGHIWMKHVEPKYIEHYGKDWDFPYAPMTEHKERFIVSFTVYGEGQQYERDERNVAERDDFLKTLQAR